MWLSFVFASQCLFSMEVAPEAGAFPAGGSLWASSAPLGVSVEDAQGHTLRFISNPTGATFEFSVDLPVGAEFFVRQISEDDAFGEKRRALGPWKVVEKKVAPMRAAPVISAAKEVDSKGFPASQGWTLTSSVAAPLYEYSFTAAKKSQTSWDTRLWVGSGGCHAPTWAWSDGPVTVRIRGHLADGSVTDWSNPVMLEVPGQR